MWKKLKAIQGQTGGEILHLKKKSGETYEDETKDNTFSEMFQEKSGRVITYHKHLNIEGQLLISVHELEFYKKDQNNNYFSMKELTDAFLTLKTAVPGGGNI